MINDNYERVGEIGQMSYDKDYCSHASEFAQGEM